MSATIDEALLAVRAEVGAVGKDDRNQQQGWNFRGVDSVVNAVAPSMIRNGVNTEVELLKLSYNQVQIGKDRSLMGHALVEVRYRFILADGSVRTATVPGEAMDSGDKAVSKAMSVALRTALLQTLLLPTREADPDHDVYERSPIAAAVLAAGPSWRRRIDAATVEGALRRIRDDAHTDGLLDAVDGETGLTILGMLKARLQDIEAAQQAVDATHAQDPATPDPAALCADTTERREAIDALRELSDNVPRMVFEAYGLPMTRVSTGRLVALVTEPGRLPSSVLAERHPPGK